MMMSEVTWDTAIAYERWLNAQREAKIRKAPWLKLFRKDWWSSDGKGGSRRPTLDELAHWIATRDCRRAPFFEPYQLVL
jgi:hypothetical protein